MLSGCGSGSGNGVTAPPLMNNPQQSNRGFSNNHVLWGYWTIEIDPSTGTYEIIPLRNVMFNANVTRFLQPPDAPVNLITILFNAGTNFPAGYVDVNVTLNHPFPGLNMFRGFDVRGIVMGGAGESFDYDSSALRGGQDDLMLMNADGYSRWWNPSEFTTYGTILGFTQGNYGEPGYMATSVINPYKYYADSLEPDTPMSEMDYVERGSFTPLKGSNTRRYQIQFPIGNNGIPQFKFDYAIDASWSLPSQDFAPEFPVEAFDFSANEQEAFMISVSDDESTAYYINDNVKGGSLILDVEIFDWQPVPIPDQVTAIRLESPLLDTTEEISTMVTPSPGGMYSSVWNIELNDLNLTGSGDFDLWIAVESKNPDTYEPQIDGDVSFFHWPSQPLTAYVKAVVDVAGISPNNAPEVYEIDPQFAVVSTYEEDVQVIGNYFLDGADITFTHETSATLSISNIEFIDPMLLTCDIQCDGPLGMYDVEVTNPDDQSGMLADGFELLEEFECGDDAHDWTGLEHNIANLPDASGPSHFIMEVIKKGPYAGMAIIETSSTTYGLIDPNGGDEQNYVPFVSTPYIRVMDIKSCETTGRIGFLGMINSRRVILFDENGVELGDFIAEDLDETYGNLTCIDFDENGDMWAVTKTGNPNDATGIWEIRHYQLLPVEPFYQYNPADTVDVSESAMTGPPDNYGVGDIGISFPLDRLFIFTANKSDGGSNLVTSWDLSTSPPAYIASLQNPYPPYTRHHIWGGSGALNRMNIDVDHRFPDSFNESCHIYLYATILQEFPTLDCYVMRIDADLNILDEGERYHVQYPADFDKVPQCAVLNDVGPDGGNLVGYDWLNGSFIEFPAPSDW
jgi:hypothetical protein